MLEGGDEKMCFDLGLALLTLFRAFSTLDVLDVVLEVASKFCRGVAVLKFCVRSVVDFVLVVLFTCGEKAKGRGGW